MNCTVCGGPFVLGSDQHAHCRAERERQAERDRRIDALLALYAEAIDNYLAGEGGSDDG